MRYRFKKRNLQDLNIDKIFSVKLFPLYLCGLISNEPKNVNKIVSLLLLFVSLASCADKYTIEGTSSVNGLDGKMLYLKQLEEGKWVKIDSAEVIHGAFSMKGQVDSVMMVSLYMGDESIMPIVLEDGDIHVTLSNTDLKAQGTPLNAALYEFIDRKNSLEESIADLEQRETRLVLDGADFEKVHARTLVEGDSLVNEMNRYVKTFISSNYENVLGPSIFLMLCSSMPYPVMTPQIDDIIKDAPYSFKNHAYVREYLSKARENMKLIEEQRRMEQNVAEKAVAEK